MNKKTNLSRFILCAQMIVALSAGIFWTPVLRAQPMEQTVVDNRLLFVFDTSAEMKKRLPMVQSVLRDFFLYEGNDQLKRGDTIGVWTFGKDIHVGEFPLQNWSSDAMGTILTNIIQYVSRQTYAKETRFDQIMPLVNKVVQGSERLTVVIFCDGDGQFVETPFDAGMNQFFQQRQRIMGKIQQPFIIILRSQMGRYAGATMNFPPHGFVLPQFPPLPPPLPPAPKSEPAKKTLPAQPRVVPPSLIIVGTNVGTNFPPPKPTAEQINGPITPPLTNIVTTNIVVAPQSGLSSASALVIAVGLFVGASVIGFLAWRRSHRADSASLITRSMNRD